MPEASNQVHAKAAIRYTEDMLQLLQSGNGVTIPACYFEHAATGQHLQQLIEQSFTQEIERLKTQQ